MRRRTEDEKRALTPREMQIAILISEGRTGHEIAEELEISVKTVDTHRGNLLDKLGPRNNVQLARHAIQSGWVTLGPSTDASEVAPERRALVV